MGDGGGGHWLVWMEWRPARWSVCLPLFIFPCTIKCRSSLLAPAHPGGPGKRAGKRLWWWWWFSVQHWLVLAYTAREQGATKVTPLWLLQTFQLSLRTFTCLFGVISTQICQVWSCCLNIHRVMLFSAYHPRSFNLFRKVCAAKQRNSSITVQYVQQKVARWRSG